MVKLPEGVLATLVIYLKTEINGVEADMVLSLEGFSSLPEFPETVDGKSIAAALGIDLSIDFTETRMMTASEVAEYRRNKAADEAGEEED